MKVNKNTIIKTAFECGLKPIESTWSIERKNTYSRYFGSEVKTSYSLKFDNDIVLKGDKTTGQDAYFTLYVFKKQDMINAELFINELTLKGYDIDITIKTDRELRRELRDELFNKIDKLQFNEDIQKVLDFIKTLNEVK